MYSVRGTYSCNSPSVVYITSWRNCADQYVGSATDVKVRSLIHKSNIQAKKYRCGTARHFNKKCWDRDNPHTFPKMQLIESMQSDVTLEGKLWERKKYWQCQVFTNTHGMNIISDLYSSKRKDVKYYQTLNTTKRKWSKNYSSNKCYECQWKPWHRQ